MRPIKRSLTIAGHRTSISLEPEFWQTLAEIAATEVTTVAALVARIDQARADAGNVDAGGLSSAVRVYILKSVRR